MKPLQQNCHVVLFFKYVVLTFESVDKMLWCYHSNETSSAVLSHGTIYLVCSSNFESVDKILWCYHSNETSSAVLSNGTIYLVCSSNFWVRGCNRMVYPFKLILSSFAFTWWESPYGVNVWKWALFVLFWCENRSPLPSTSDYDWTKRQRTTTKKGKNKTTQAFSITFNCCFFFNYYS